MIAEFEGCETTIVSTSQRPLSIHWALLSGSYIHILFPSICILRTRSMPLFYRSTSPRITDNVLTLSKNRGFHASLALRTATSHRCLELLPSVRYLSHLSHSFQHPSTSITTSNNSIYPHSQIQSSFSVGFKALLTTLPFDLAMGLPPTISF